MTTSNAVIAPVPTVSIVNNHAITTSKAIAEFFGKRHDNIIRSIDNLKVDLEPSFYLLNFEEVYFEVQNPNGGFAKYRAFNITKDGFTLLVMGFTGKEALAFKVAYINRFNEMETALKTSPPTFDLAETLSQTLNQISKGNKKLYMSMYNGLTRRFAVGRLADIPHTEIHNALATIYFFAVEWHRKNTPTQLPLKLNDGEHYLVVKDGVVLWERKLKSNCNDIPANTLQNPKLMLEHIREVVGEFVGKEALPAPKPQNIETVRELVERVLIQNFTLNHIWKSLHALDKGLYLRAINYVVNTNVRVLRVIEDFGFKTKQGNDMISCDFRTIQLYDGRTITGCNPNYFNAFA